jgi:hypothetical protein
MTQVTNKKTKNKHYKYFLLYLCKVKTVPFMTDNFQSFYKVTHISPVVEIQFQMDRGLFCMMHHAIDSLKSSDIVFPDISKINPQWNEKHVIKVR